MRPSILVQRVTPFDGELFGLDGKSMDIRERTAGQRRDQAIKGTGQAEDTDSKTVDNNS